MYQNLPTTGFTTEANSNTWFLIANRGGAKILASEGGLRNLRLLEEIPHPEGRHDTEGDRESRDTGGRGTGDQQSRGGHNKTDSASHVAQLFAKNLAAVLRKGRADNAYTKLVLVAESRFLGELRSSMDDATQKTVEREIEKDIYKFSIGHIQNYLSENLLPA